MAKAKNFYDSARCGFTSIVLDSLFLLLQVLIGYFEGLVRFVFPPPYKSLENEIILVTGGGQGIGKEICKQIARVGVKSIAIWDINLTNAERTAKEIFEETGISVKAFHCDVSKREAVAETARLTKEALGPVTVLFNNAGIMPCKPLLKHTPSDIERVFEVNVYSQFWTLFEYLPEFLERNHGHIVALSSTAGVTGTPNLTAYCATKHAVKGLMEATYLELRKSNRDHKIKMTTVLPFTINTGLAHKPTTRFEHFIPIIEPDEAARIIVDAMRRDEAVVYVPRHLSALFAPVNLFPLKVKLALYDFLGCGVEEHD